MADEKKDEEMHGQTGEEHKDGEGHGFHGKHFGKDFHFNFKFDKLNNLKAMGKELRSFIHESISGGRVNVIMVRVQDEVLEDIDSLLSADIFKSRSEAAAFLIGKGLEATKELFGMVMEKTAKIEELRAEIRDVLGMTDKVEEEIPTPENEDKTAAEE